MSVTYSSVPHLLLKGRKLVEWNSAFAALFPWVEAKKGTTLHQFLGKSHGMLAREILALEDPAGSHEEVHARQVRLAASNGGGIFCDIGARRVPGEERYDILLSFVEMTAWHEESARLHASEEQHRILADSGVSPLVVIQENRVVFANRAAESLFAFSQDKGLMGRDIASLVVGRERRSALAKLRPGEIGDRTVASLQCAAVRGDGEPVSVEIRAETIEFNGAPALLASFTDLTSQHKTTEDARRRMHEDALLEQILQIAEDAFRLDPLLTVSLDACLKVLAVDAGGAYGLEEGSEEMTLHIQRNLPEKVLERLTTQRSQEGTCGYVVRTADPLVLHVEDYPAHLPYKALFAEAGYKTVVYVPFHTGPTVHAVLLLASSRPYEQLQVSQELFSRLGAALGAAALRAGLFDRTSESEELYRSAVEGALPIMYVAKPNGAFTLLSPRVEQLLGYTAAEFRRNPDLWRNLIHPDQRSAYSARIAHEGKETDHLFLEYQVLPRGKASYRRVVEAVRYVRDENGLVTLLVGAVTDVTEEQGLAHAVKPGDKNRDDLEREIRESEQTLRNVIDAMGDALLITDLQGRVWEVNHEFTELTGYGRSEALGAAFPYPWLVEREMATFVSWITALREKQFLRDFDMTWRHKDGRELAMSINTNLLRNVQGEPVAMVNIARDISDRKRLANELEVKNKQIEMLNRIISKANSTIDFQKIFETVAVEILDLLSYDQISVSLLSEDGRFLTVLSSMSPGGPTLPLGTRQLLEETPAFPAVERGAATIIDDIRASEELPARIRTHAGFRAYVIIPILLKRKPLGVLTLASLSPSSFTPGALDYLLPIADQTGAVIERMQLFEKVSADSAYIRNLMDSLDSVVFTVDADVRIGELNSAWRGMAAFLGSDLIADEKDASGRMPDELIPATQVWNEVRAVAPALFAGSRKVYEREFDLAGADGSQRIYYLTVSPVEIGETVTALVCSITDITESKRSEEELRRRNRELTALNAVSAAINTSLNLDQVLGEAARQVRDNTGASAVLCYLRPKDSGRLVLAHQMGVPEELLGGIRTLDAASSLMGQAMTGRSPVVVDSSVSDDARVTPEGRHVITSLGMKSLLVLPLISKDDVLGALTVAYAEEHGTRAGEQEFLTLIGNQLGAAIENAQLYAEVHAQVRRISALYELSQGLSGAVDRDTLIEIVSTEVNRTLPYDRFAYHAYRRSDGELEVAVEVSDGKRYMTPRKGTRAVVAQDAEPAARRVIAEGQSVLERGPDGASVLAVPIRTRGDIVGVLSLERRQSPPFETGHLRLLESIANLTKIAADRTLLYEDIIAKSEELEARNKELDDFTYVVSHDLKEPLITIEGFSKIVLNEYRERLDDEGKGYLTSLVHSSVRMKQLIDDLLTLSRLGRVADVQTTVSVRDVLKDILHDFEFTLRGRHARVEIPEGLPEVVYNPTQLGMVFRNLIGNGVKFNRSEEPLVRIGVEETAEEYRFSVADNGVGIAPQHFEKVFVIFQRLHRRDEYEGTGAGLTIVKKIVENHGGRIWVESIPGEGTTFTFTVPKQG